MSRKRKKSSRAQGIFPMKKKAKPDPWYGMGQKPKYPTGFPYHSSKQDKPGSAATGEKVNSTSCGEHQDKSDEPSDPV